MNNKLVIKDKGYKQVKINLDNIHRARTKVGLPQEGTIKAGEVKSMLDLVRIGAIQEFGAPKRNIPQRSFVRSTFDNRKSNLLSICQSQYKNVVLGKLPAKKALGIIGEYLTNETKMAIKNRIPPPNAPMTIAQKGSDVPLIDTAQMIQSIQHVEIK